MSDKPKEVKKLDKPKKRKVIERDTMSRQRVEQIQRNGLGKMRRRLYAMGITKIDDLI